MKSSLPQKNREVWRSADSLSTREGHMSFVSITALPGRLPANWLSDLLLRLPYAAASVAVYPLSKEAAISMTERFALGVSSELLYRSETGRRCDDLSEKLDQAMELGERLRADDLRLYYASVILCVVASSPSQLKHRTAALSSELGSRSVGLSKMKYRQERGLRAFTLSLPPAFQDSPVISSDSIRALLPLTQSPMLHQDGTFIGINALDGTPIVFDRFSPVNFNSIVVGKSGSGKSFLAKALLMREHNRADARYFIIDPLGEFFTAAMRSGGEVVDVASEGIGIGSMVSGELFSISPYLVSFLKRVCNLPEERCVLLRRALVDVSSGPNASSSSALTRELSDIAPAGSDKATDLSAFLLRGKSPFSAGRMVTVFDLVRLPRDLMEPAIALISGIVFEMSKRLPGRKTMIVDEAWAMSRDPPSARLLAEIMRHSRHHNLGVMLISQNFDDFLEEEYGETLLNNCSSYFIFRHEKLSTRTISFLEFSDDEAAFLSASTPRVSGTGKCMLVCTGRKIPVLIPPLEGEVDSCNSDAGRRPSPESLLCSLALSSLDASARLLGVSR